MNIFTKSEIQMLKECIEKEKLKVNEMNKSTDLNNVETSYKKIEQLNKFLKLVSKNRYY